MLTLRILFLIPPLPHSPLQITLPRAAGTCTRVPTEVRLHEDPGQWTCKIMLRFETDEHGNVSLQAVSWCRDVEKRSLADLPFFCMTQPQDAISEMAFGEPIFDPSLVEAALRRAQLAILNPSVIPERFVTYKLPAVEEYRPLGSKKHLAFSKNTVCIDISGPAVTDLTLIDLPGIIQSVGKGEDKANIDLVTDLVKHYIQKDCLILLVITMKGRSQLQRARTSFHLTYHHFSARRRHPEPEGSHDGSRR